MLVGPMIDRNARSLPKVAARLAADAIHEPLGLFAVEALDYALHLGKTGADAFREMVRDRIEDKLPRVAALTLVVRGERDAIVPLAWAREVAGLLRRGRLVDVPGAAHAVNYDAPDALTRLVLEHLTEPA